MVEGGEGEVENGFQSLILKVDVSDTPQRRIGFKVKFEGMMEMGSIDKGVECVSMMTFKGSPWR